MMELQPDDPGNPALLERIKSVIRAQGRITFAEFMRMALYEPGLGYYMTTPERSARSAQSNGSARSGREGDYFTAPELHPIFGQMVGRQVAEMADLLHRLYPSEEITVIEMGTGRGLMAEDILRVCAERRPARIRYVAIEINPMQAAEQRARLAPFAGQGISVHWCRTLEESVAETQGLTGVIVSNELVDAFPVHRVVMQGGRLLERFVRLEGERLSEELDLPSTQALENYFTRLSVRLPEGFQTEVNLEALEWIARIGRMLRAGFVLTIDYGHTAEERYAVVRRNGTLACFASHRRRENPYLRIGLQDLTAHVDFSALTQAGREAGLMTTGFTDQTSFLLGLGAADAMEARLAACDDLEREVELSAMKLLLASHRAESGAGDEGMGRIFKVLIQHKGVSSPRLSGLTFRPFVLPETFA
ncbi:MAG TPA: SAM-dependent methyltransferase [Nitrospiria bacterium]|nr:SAM-dependent methyltransferase [Nitrospiria bacterium]